MRLTRLLLIAVLSLMVSTARAAGADGAVGMVLDLQGSGQIKDSSGVSKLQLLAYLKPKMQVTLDAGAKASLTLYANRTVYQFTGPAVVDVEKEQLNVVQGKPPVTKTMQEKLVAAVENMNLTPGAVRLRGLGIKIYTPMNNSVMLDTHPTFSWSADDDKKFDVTIEDESGKQVFSTKVVGTSWQLPANVKLNYGATYTWRVGYAELADAPKPVSGQFSIAEKVIAESTRVLKPSPAAAVEEWIMYAMTLHDRGMQTDARSAWQLVCAQRPDLSKACELAKAEQIRQ